MDSMNELIREYKAQLTKGKIQKAYKGIMTFMVDLKSSLESNYPAWKSGALYFGYMDMTYFAFTPPALKNKKLKIAIVFLHEACKFEVWLAGNNRRIQAETIDLLKNKDLGKYVLSQVQPGVDSIVSTVIVDCPDFDHPDKLKKQIGVSLIDFANDMMALLNNIS